jgi:hypothetical protein
LNYRVKAVEFDTSISGRELPLDLDLLFIALQLPGLDLSAE